jgi:dienelactone hydrolase
MRTLSPIFVTLALLTSPVFADPLPDTKPLTLEGDPAAKMVEGIHKYLDRELAGSVAKRKQYWKLDFSSSDAYVKSVQPQRERLARILGVVDPRIPIKALEYVATTADGSLVAETDAYRVHAVRWPVSDGVDAEGLLLEPKGKPVACVVAIPDADCTPEMLIGLAPGPKARYQDPEGTPDEDKLFSEAWWKIAWPKAQFARRLAENGCQVLVPTLIDRNDTWSGNPKVRMTNQPHREFIYRMAYQNGRHVIGYEIQKVLAAVDWFCRDKDHPPVGIYGYGAGGLIALYAGALDERIRATVVSGYFGRREALWQEPIYRNVWGLLREFGDAEVAAHLFNVRRRANGEVTNFRKLIIEDCKRPRVDGPPVPSNSRSGAAPGELLAPDHKANSAEAQRAEKMGREGKYFLGLVYCSVGSYIAGWEDTFEEFLAALGVDAKLRPNGKPAHDRRKNFDPAARQKRQFDQLVTYSQKLMRKSEARRREFFWSKLDTSSPEKYQKTTQALRDYYWDEVIGKLPKPDAPMNPRTRLAYDQPKWKGYEVMLDLYPNVFAYGVLLVPKDLKPGQKRPVVVCQHGLEGTPKDVVDPKVKSVYNSFGAQLADRGFIVYAPQNPYKGGNTFRQINRKANPLKLTMFSFIVRQHERTLDWLATLPFVVPERIAFYGLSYGGETAVRVPPLVGRYALSICSADFNHFPWKTCTLDFGASYMLVNTYEIFDFNMNNTFSHAEMAALIAPRPFMVERGHEDGVGLDEWVSYEYAKVRRLYARLKLSDRTAIEFFDGGHEIHGMGTFAFLEKHLKWPKK